MLSSWQKNPWLRTTIAFAIAFFVLTLLLTLHRYYTFYASFDQGIFNQVFWNGTHGRFFQSSLSSTLSTNVVHNGEVPSTSYHRLGQHFTPALLLWLPIYALFPWPVTLTILQVTLVSGAGLVLYVLARQHLSEELSAAIAIGYYGANAIIGPTLSNFADNCQIPLFVFTLLLAMEKGWWRLFWFLAVCILAVRADGGISLFGVGAYMVLSRRFPRAGLAACTLGFGYMLVLTNLIMPLFSEDISRRFMLERFGQYVDKDEATTLDILWAFISQPWLVLVELLTPFDRKIRYLLGQWLPFAFVPAFSGAAWAIAGFPLLAIFLQQGQSPLAINIRYAMTVVPGLCYGTILWWSGRQDLLNAPLGEFVARAGKSIAALVSRIPLLSFQGAKLERKASPKVLKISMKRFWTICICLSILFSITSNPNRTFYFLIPDSIDPWVYVSLPRQWQHSSVIYSFLAKIPADKSVAATTYIVPHLSGRREIVRFPSLLLRNDRGVVISMEYAIADLWQFQQYLPAFKHDRRLLDASATVIERVYANGDYGIKGFKDGVILMQRDTESDPAAVAAWQAYRQEVEPLLRELDRDG